MFQLGAVDTEFGLNNGNYIAGIFNPGDCSLKPIFEYAEHPAWSHEMRSSPSSASPNPGATLQMQLLRVCTKCIERTC